MTPADLERFRKICGLLASGHDGERAAAAKKASELLAMNGLSWSSVSLPVEQPDVLAQRREAMGKSVYQTAEQAHRDAQQAIRDLQEAINRANPSRADRAEKRAAWRERSYGADSDGFEPGRK